MEDVTYLKINLYLRMLHPMTTTGIAPVLILLVLNVRITRGIMQLQVSFGKVLSMSVWCTDKTHISFRKGFRFVCN